MTDSDAVPKSELIIYQTADGRTRIECRFEGETVWLSQALMAELFDIGVGTVNHHLKEIYAENELLPEATIRRYRIVRNEGKRTVSREIEFYNLDAIIAVGYRVRSARGTQFRRLATARLSEYLMKGFTMDDERLKNPPGPGATDYLDELLERVRDIRASERRFYQKVLDIHATSIDYEPSAELSQQFFATVQNKMHWATHGLTAAEIVHECADGDKPLMGMQTTRHGGVIRKADATIAKNYLTEPELQVLHRIVNLYIEYAEVQALERLPMTMRDWIKKLDEFLKASGPAAPRSRRDHLGGGRKGEGRARVRALSDARGREATRDRRCVREGRKATQEACSNASKVATREVVTARGERSSPANPAAKTAKVLLPVFSLDLALLDEKVVSSTLSAFTKPERC